MLPFFLTDLIVIMAKQKIPKLVSISVRKQKDAHGLNGKKVAIAISGKARFGNTISGQTRVFNKN